MVMENGGEIGNFSFPISITILYVLYSQFLKTYETLRPAQGELNDYA